MRIIINIEKLEHPHMKINKIQLQGYLKSTQTTSHTINNNAVTLTILMNSKYKVHKTTKHHHIPHSYRITYRKIIFICSSISKTFSSVSKGCVKNVYHIHLVKSLINK